MKHTARRCESTYDAVGAAQRSPHLNAPRTKGLPLERPAAQHENPDVIAVGKRRAHVHKRAKPVDNVDRDRFGEAAPNLVTITAKELKTSIVCTTSIGGRARPKRLEPNDGQGIKAPAFNLSVLATFTDAT